MEELVGCYYDGKMDPKMVEISFLLNNLHLDEGLGVFLVVEKTVIRWAVCFSGWLWLCGEGYFRGHKVVLLYRP